MTTYREALNALLSVCDGAAEKDDHGYNGADAPIARSFASQPSWTVKQQGYVKGMLLKYTNQLSNFGIVYSELTEEPVRDIVKAKQEVVAKILDEKPILDFKDGKFSFKIAYDKRDLAKSIPKHYWDNDKKVWLYNKDSKDVIENLSLMLAEHTDVIIKPSALEIIKEHFASKNKLAKDIVDVASFKVDELPDIPVPLKTKPYEHQKRAFMIGTTLAASGLFMEMGTGKTMASIAIMGKRFINGEITKLLVMCPLSILHVWAQEFSKHADFPVNVVILRDSTMVVKKKRISTCNVEGKLNVIVVSYESAWRMPEEIKAWNPDAIILDESQRIKNKRAKRSEFVHELGDLVKYKLILTGTPITQSPLDLFSQYRFLNKTIFGKSFFEFRNKYCTMGGFQRKEVVGFQNLEELIEKAHSIAYRVTKEEALDLPEFTDSILYFDLKESASIYKEMDKDMKTKLEDKSCNTSIVLSQMLRLAQITGGFLPMLDKDGKETVQQIGHEKLDLLKEIVEDFPLNKKLVIFCNFIPEIKAIDAMLTDMKVTHGVIYGDVKSEDRQRINDDFQNKDSPRAIILQVRVGGLGITLTKADTMVFYSNSFSFGDYQQARARIHRSGQVNKCTYIQLVGNNTIDETIVKALVEKKNIADVVIDMVGGVV